MCFSAEASFAAAALIGATGAVAMVRTTRAAELPLAAMPLFFAAQQTAEGFLWLALGHGADPETSAHTAAITSIFLHMALVFWPVFAPVAYLLAEPDAMRRRYMVWCLAAGIVTGAYFLWSLYTNPQVASAGAGHIVYSGDPELPAVIRLLYPIATCLGAAFSSHGALRLLSAILFLSSIVAYAAYWQSFSSVWCFFAAIASGVIVFHFERVRRARSAPI